MPPLNPRPHILKCLLHTSTLMVHLPLQFSVGFPVSSSPAQTCFLGCVLGPRASPLTQCPLPERSKTIPNPRRPGRLGVENTELGLGMRLIWHESFAFLRGVLGGRSQEMLSETDRWENQKPWMEMRRRWHEGEGSRHSPILICLSHLTSPGSSHLGRPLGKRRTHAKLTSYPSPVLCSPLPACLASWG